MYGLVSQVSSHTRMWHVKLHAAAAAAVQARARCKFSCACVAFACIHHKYSVYICDLCLLWLMEWGERVIFITLFAIMCLKVLSLTRSMHPSISTTSSDLYQQATSENRRAQTQLLRPVWQVATGGPVGVLVSVGHCPTESAALEPQVP